MGDMKTPDFDDLLAAFDIPDATGLDAKEAIQSSSDEVEGHIKPAGMCVDENIVTAPDVPVVSVIVKNTSRQDSLESCPEKDSSHFGQNILQNGFQSPDHIPDCQNATQTTYDPAFMNGSSSSSLPERNAVQHTDTMPSFSQFSPISSPEPEDSEISNAVVHKPADFPAPSLFDTSQCSVLDNQKNIPDFNMFDQCYMNDAKSESANIPDKDCEIHWDEPVTVEDRKRDTVKQHAKKKYFHGMDLLPLNNVDSDLDEPVKVIDSNPNLSLLAPSRHHIKSENSKFSSCLAALAALNSKEVDTVMDEPPLITREVSMSLKEVKISPKISKSPKSPRSPLEVVKRCATKQPDSPVSICSESSSKLSPSVNAGSPPAIPKVRIKTIKTSSGQIKRTVTSVLPDSEQEDLQSPPESSPLQYPALEYSALNVTPSSSPSLSSHENTSHSEKIKTPEKNTSTFVIPSNENQKLSNRKQERCEKTPEATTASLLCNGNSSTTVSSPNVVQQNQMSSTLSTANLLPKAVHLANLNLVPHSVAASVTARSAAQRQNQTQLTTQIVCSTVPLVHQVKKAASTPVPTFPNAVVVALNKLLNSANPVPLYVPNLNPPAECNIHLPTRGYRCLECGDSFGLEKSLAQHYGRRSMHIEVACNHCAKTLLFYNKCSLLAHAREHKTKGIVMQCSQLFMKPIPPEKMFASTSAFSSVASALQVTPITSNSSVPETVANTEPVMPLYPEKVTQRGFKCLDCNKQAPDYPALASHYQQPGQSGWKTCSECLMMLPNKCSYAAHQRIHSRKPPYCCPECGSVCRPSDFQSHLKKNCLHYARKIAYKCLHCDSVFMYFHQLKSHTEQKHCEILHKCSVCTMAYRSAEGVISHIQKKHATTNASTQLIYRCSCEIMFNNKKSLFQHISKQIICVFKCPECQLAFMQKMLLMQHFKSVHAAPQTREVPETQRNNVNLSSDHKLLFSTIRRLNSTDNLKDTPVPKSESNFKKAGWSCALCSQILPDREAYVSHMKKSHGKSVKRYPCRHCERSFSSSTSLKRHTRNDHNGKKVYTCWYCTDEKITFSKHFMLKNHISLIHGIKNPDFSQMSRDLQQENKNDMCSSELPVKRTADDADTEGSKNNTSAVSPPKKLKTEYKCAKCGFSTENTTEFQAHIPQHKSDSPTFQCLHCCLCYTSHISLNRHLFIVHKIKDPEKEDLQFDVCKKNIEISHLQRKSIINTENEETKIQCNFCSEIFKKQSEYSFHLKSHRMDNLNEERVDINQ